MVATADDDLRFGDLGGGGGSSSGAVDKLVNLFQVIVIGYVLPKVVEVVFNIPIPLI